MRAWLIFIYLLLIELYSFISENLRMTFFQTLISFCTCSLKQQLFMCEVELYIIINYNIHVDNLYHSIANYDNTAVFVLSPHTLDSQ